MRSIRWTLAVLAAFFLFAGAAQASTITVSVTDDPVGAGSCPAAPCSLRQAIATASADDVIQLGGTAQDPIVYTLTQGSTILVSQNLTIAGNGPGATIVDGIGNLASDSQPVRIFKVTAGTVSFDSLAMRNGGDSHDENDFPGPDPTLTLNGGGALFVQAGTVTLDTVGFQDNRAPTGGAVSINSGTLTMSDTWFRQSGGAIGGALFVRGGTVTGSRLTFEANGTGAFGGGAAFLYGGAMTLTNSTIAGNGSASSFGGGIANDAGTLTLQNDTFKNNA